MPLLVLSCLVQLVSVRRSLFTNPERQTFLGELVGGTRTILANQSASLSNPETYHEFCRLLSRLKCNFQLTELIGLDCYAEFIQLITAFTVHSLKSFPRSTNSNSIHYLLALWQRLVASLPYVQSPDSELLENAASQVSRTYIEACLASVPDYVNCPSHIRSASTKPGKADNEPWAGFGSAGTGVNRTRRSKAGRGDSFVEDEEDDVSECPLDDLTTLSQQLEQSDMTRIIFMQRKLSASFRDSLLLPIFRLGLNLLREADKNISSLDLSNLGQVSYTTVSWLLQFFHPPPLPLPFPNPGKMFTFFSHAKHVSFEVVGRFPDTEKLSFLVGNEDQLQSFRCENSSHW
ncbi:unnamed protein product [Echinostoma caproni]|uniref:Uncharacterized protein n=1 Tax=Echinostoma caproni TaxID=27848 RepID=A0A183BBC6_9TREM|nr:unnamed protein product [Echinostoma caproni]